MENRTSRLIYFDNNATTQVAPEVLEEMMPYFTEYYGNPSSLYPFGGQMAAEISRARARVAELIGARLDVEIYFTSGATESNNTAIRGALALIPKKRHIIISQVEHDCVLNVAADLEADGYSVTRIGVDRNGQIDLNELEKNIRPDTALISIMYANNETGVIFPVEEIAELAKEYGVLYHCDAVQVVGKLPVNVSKFPVDLLSLSGHKIHGPKGIGALYIRRGVRIKPFILGGQQERGRRGGTENVPAIVGLRKACELAGVFLREGMSVVRDLRDELERGIISEIPMTQVNGHDAQRLPNTTNISFEGLEGEAALLALNELGVCASSGSACASGKFEPSHVLRAMGVHDHLGHGSLRFSLGRYNTDEEVNVVVKELPAIVNRLRKWTPSKNWREGVAL